ncbi:MAG: fluoride efflux transporter CrcB [Lutibacter sp.]|uniref:fluoride efflux transporter CrcB n=1 Tax=Lutibacter sp. TaxID=1925666 RepID=UPI0017F60EA7|nr:fluoride efflux transporter CrcB [Lutibacter sp.]MBT8317544.1 fluoride efflux transporter CrcB [Lutibacter sp.]NNJ58403.1 fluoride efflux transporter CrcB [Lutibacter sp.]
MKQALLVFVGGGFGSVARFFLGKWFNNIENTIPFGTMLSNVLGSLLIGIILGYLGKTGNMSQNQSLLLATGFCGGFTTFSTFAYENHLLIKNGDYFSFLPYTLLSLFLGFSAVFLGLYISKFI